VICCDQADIHPAFHGRTSNRVNEFKKNQKALCIVWQYAFYSHVYVSVPSKFAKGKVERAYNEMYLAFDEFWADNVAIIPLFDLVDGR
jgi:hypothetical protein